MQCEDLVELKNTLFVTNLALSGSWLLFIFVLIGLAVYKLRGRKAATGGKHQHRRRADYVHSLLPNSKENKGYERDEMMAATRRGDNDSSGDDLFTTAWTKRGVSFAASTTTTTTANERASSPPPSSSSSYIPVSVTPPSDDDDDAAATISHDEL